MGVRIGDAVAYVTDTTTLEATETFARGVRLLLHETWMTDDEAERDEEERSRHSSVSGVARVAKRAGATCLMPVHHHPRRSDSDIMRLVETMRDLTGREVWVPEERKVYELD